MARVAELDRSRAEWGAWGLAPASAPTARRLLPAVPGSPPRTVAGSSPSGGTGRARPAWTLRPRRRPGPHLGTGAGWGGAAAASSLPAGRLAPRSGARPAQPSSAAARSHPAWCGKPGPSAAPAPAGRSRRSGPGRPGSSRPDAGSRHFLGRPGDPGPQPQRKPPSSGSSTSPSP